MTSRIYKIFYNFIDFLSFQIFKIAISFRNLNNCCVLDIDNTIADTWPSLVKKSYYKNDFYRYASLNLHPNANVIFNEYHNFPKIYISARPIYFYFTTLKWLRNNTDTSYLLLLILVPTANSKLKYLKYLSKKINHLIYIDDLSYNHENGSVKFYQEIIDSLSEIEVTYFGADYINNPNRL